MTVALAMPLRRSRHGYVMVPRGRRGSCPSPLSTGRLRVSPRWAAACFLPAYARAAVMWGGNASAISSEVLAELVPSLRVDAPATGAERELRRRVATSVAALLNASGIRTPYPPAPRTPRPSRMPPGPPWYRALLTGWP